MPEPFACLSHHADLSCPLCFYEFWEVKAQNYFALAIMTSTRWEAVCLHVLVPSPPGSEERLCWCLSSSTCLVPTGASQNWVSPVIFTLNFRSGLVLTVKSSMVPPIKGSDLKLKDTCLNLQHCTGLIKLEQPRAGMLLTREPAM